MERCQAVSNELVKQKGLNASLAEELKRTQARYENLAVSFERVRDKLHLMRMGPNKSSVAQGAPQRSALLTNRTSADGAS